MACDSANSRASMVRIKEIAGTGLERKSRASMVRIKEIAGTGLERKGPYVLVKRITYSKGRWDEK
jgi:hypothetical protein